MRIGVLIPEFVQDAKEAIRVTRVAEEQGIHGAFCYDHLWPMGEPGRPAISPYPLLGALSQMTTTMRLGTLVSRVGIVPNEVLYSELMSLHELCRGRFIASLGTGDHKSADENIAYGAEFAPASERRFDLSRIATALVAAGVEVWIGGGASATDSLAASCGAALNLWSASEDEVAARIGTDTVTWAGRLPETTAAASAQLVALERMGVTWAVYIWPGSFEPLVEVAKSAGVTLGE